MDGYRHQVNTHPDILRIFSSFPFSRRTIYRLSVWAPSFHSHQSTDHRYKYLLLGGKY